MKVCVVGTGNVGSAYAAWLARAGCGVTLLKTTPAPSPHFDAVRARGGVLLRDLDGSETFAPLPLVTREPGDALGTALDAVVVATQTHAHEAVAALCAQNLRSAKLVLVTPGYLGSVYFRRALRGVADAVAEGESPAFDARIEEPGAVRIHFRNVRNALAFLPRSRRDAGLEVAERLVGTYRYSRESVLESALNNPNLILHTVGCVASAARIERAQGAFRMYEEGFTPGVWRAVERLDAERMRVLSAFGCAPIPYLSACQFRNGADLSGDSLETFRRYGRENGPSGPSSLDSRYLTEDVPVGLGLLRSLGRASGVATPLADALFELAGALLGRDFQPQARTLERLGFESADALRAFLREN